MNWPATALVILTAALTTPGFTVHITRADFLVSEAGGNRIYLREVLTPSLLKKAPAILLIHGARVPGIASFDLDVPGGSLAADLAERGLAVYVMDVLGYGASTRPKEMDESPIGEDALVRSNQVAHDIAAVVDWICSRRGVAKMALFGWATGGQWAGYYTSVFPEKVGALVL